MTTFFLDYICKTFCLKYCINNLTICDFFFEKWFILKHKAIFQTASSELIATAWSKSAHGHVAHISRSVCFLIGCKVREE